MQTADANVNGEVQVTVCVVK